MPARHGRLGGLQLGAPAFEVANGAHKLEVRAVKAGEPDPTPAEREWWADATIQNGNFETATGNGWLQQGYQVAGWNRSSSTDLSVAGGAGGGTAGRPPPPGPASLPARRPAR